MPATFIYFIKPVGMDGPIKIGCSATPLSRLVSLMSWCPYELELLAQAPGGYAEERRLGYRFRKHWLRAEWFRPAPELTALIADIAESHCLPFPVLQDIGRRALLGLPAILNRHGISVADFAKRGGVKVETVKVWTLDHNGPACVGHAAGVLEEMGIGYPLEALFDGPEPKRIERRPYRPRSPKIAA